MCSLCNILIGQHLRQEIRHQHRNVCSGDIAGGILEWGGGEGIRNRCSFLAQNQYEGEDAVCILESEVICREAISYLSKPELSVLAIAESRIWVG